MPDDLEPESPPPEADDRSFEGRRAEDLGLPTDPEAYQDGGMAVAATALTVVEADLLVAILRSQGVPAWVDAARSVINAAPAGPVSIVVPLGRLADAQEVLRTKRDLDLPADDETTDAAAVRGADVPVALTSLDPAEADLLAVLLGNRGIPAWTEGRLVQPARPFDPLSTVMVPGSRLEEARQIMAEAGQGPKPQETESPSRPRSMAPWIIFLITILGGCAVAGYSGAVGLGPWDLSDTIMTFFYGALATLVISLVVWLAIAALRPDSSGRRKD